MRHTALPWYLDKPHGCDPEIWHGKIGDADRALIAEYMSESNAQFIVTACNSHEQLVEACKKLILHRHQANLHPIDFHRVEQALKKAEEEVICPK